MNRNKIVFKDTETVNNRYPSKSIEFFYSTISNSDNYISLIIMVFMILVFSYLQIMAQEKVPHRKCC